MTLKRKAIIGLAMISIMLMGSISSVSAATWGNNSWSNMGTRSSGDSGARVYAIQDILRSQGSTVSSPGTYDGIFGANTIASVKSFQKKYGLSQDGIVGTNTWKKMRTFIAVSTQHASTRDFDIASSTGGIVRYTRFWQNTSGTWKCRATSGNSGSWITMKS